MPRWDRYIKTKDADKEKELAKIIKLEKDYLNELEYGLLNESFFNKWEPFDEQVSYGAI